MTDSHRCDENADARVRSVAWEAYRHAAEIGGNPSSGHASGLRARAILDDARSRILKALDADAGTLVLTSGGTEADALAVRGGVLLAGERPLACSSFEHPAVRDQLQMEGSKRAWNVIPNTPAGKIDEEQLRDLNPGFLSLVWACSETGLVQPVAECADALPSTFVHSDAVQALGRSKVSFAKSGVAMLSGSAHKLGAVAGTGFLILREDVRARIEPILIGGGQEFGLRAGTENVAGAAALAAVLELNRDEESKRMRMLRDGFESLCAEALSGVTFVGNQHERLDNVSCVRFAGVQADGLLMACDLNGYSVSAGTACSSGSLEPSDVLLSLGMSETQAKEVVRFSFDSALAPDVIDGLVACLAQAVKTTRSLG